MLRLASERDAIEGTALRAGDARDDVVGVGARLRLLPGRLHLSDRRVELHVGGLEDRGVVLLDLEGDELLSLGLRGARGDDLSFLGAHEAERPSEPPGAGLVHDPELADPANDRGPLLGHGLRVLARLHVLEPVADLRVLVEGDVTRGEGVATLVVRGGLGERDARARRRNVGPRLRVLGSGRPLGAHEEGDESDSEGGAMHAGLQASDHSAKRLV